MARWMPLLAVGFAALASAAVAGVNVRFVLPDRYSDPVRVDGYEASDRNRALDEIKQHLIALGGRCIVPSQSLEILVRDVNLAGQSEMRPGPGGDFWRTLVGVSDAWIELEYVLRAADGTVLGKGADRIGEAAYLPQRVDGRGNEDLLFHERKMLTEWFDRRFCKVRGATK